MHRFEDPARRPGGDRLSRGLGRSTMGAGAFHGRVRDGIGCGSPAMATGPPGRILHCACPRSVVRPPMRAIKTGFCACVPLRVRARLGAACGAPASRRDVAAAAVWSSIGRLGPLGWVGRPTCTRGLSTCWSSTTLEGNSVSRWVSRLDAFSGYPVRTWLPGGAAGATTGAPGVRPSRSSRTGDGSSQVSFTRGR